MDTASALGFWWSGETGTVVKVHVRDRRRESNVAYWSKKKNVTWRKAGIEESCTRSAVASHGISLAFVHTHVLSKVIVAAKVLSTSFHRTFVSCKSHEMTNGNRTEDTHASHSCESIVRAA